MKVQATKDFLTVEIPLSAARVKTDTTTGKIENKTAPAIIDDFKIYNK